MRREGRSVNSIRSLAKRFFASFVFACVLVGTGYAGLVRVQAAATPPRIVMYQGRLLNSNGVPVSDATASISFALYDAASAGTCLWSNNSPTCASVVARTVTLTSGLFSEALGDTAAATPYSAIASTVFSNNASVYLEVIVNGETLVPRKAMLSAPYAMNSDSVDGYDTSLVGATSSVVPITDTNGNLVITGSPQGTGVSQASLYINPATGVVAANEILLGVAVSDASRFSIDAEGDSVLLGNLAVNGGGISSSSALAITSSGGDISFGPNGTGLVYVTAGDDFAVGGTSLVSPFSIDESANTLRIGDGTSDANDPTITFYASDATDSGSLSYSDSDTFSFTGGNFSHVGLGTMPTAPLSARADHDIFSTFSGTSPDGYVLNQLYTLRARTTYTGMNGSSSSNLVGGSSSFLTIDGETTTLADGIGFFSQVTNTASTASLLDLGGFLAGIDSSVLQSGGQTIATGYGIYGHIGSSGGTFTNGIAVYGVVTSGAGSFTTGYGGKFVDTTEGTTRYGVYGDASGGTNNYSGYFTGAALQVDDDSTPDAAGFATAAGDIYAVGTIEADGSAYFGDSTGTDTFTFTSAQTTGTSMTVTSPALTTGVGMKIVRASGGADYDGSLLQVLQQNTSATSDAVAVSIVNSAAGSSTAMWISQDSTGAHVPNQIVHAIIGIDTNETGSSDDAIVFRSDADGTPDTEFRVTTAGDAFVDGAFTGAGADFAEFFPTADTALGDQDIVCLDGALAKNVKRCDAGETNIVGVVSTNPAFIGNNIGDGTEDYRGNSRYRLVGLIGQIDTKVSTANGPIAVGDPISTSSSLAGYGSKAHGPVRIVGFALQSLSSGTGVIRVLVSPQWYGGDVLTATGSATQVAGSLAIAATTAATATTTVVDSGTLSLRGSAWAGGSAQIIGMSLKTAVSAVNDYRLSVANSIGTEVASVNQSGDLAIAGRLYPSDRGASQKSKYIYYDGSSGSGGDFMRTNSAGWATGSYDFAEMFPSPDVLMPGEIVVFGDASQQVKRSTGKAYSQTIAGIVSTRPGFLAGENRSGNYPIALAGRVPTLVSTENGAINIGDPLTTSTHPGYAMKATEAGPILGYAAESFSGSMGSVVVYVNVSYYSGAPVTEGPAADNFISQLTQDIENFDTAGTLNFNGGQLLAIGSMTSANGTWRLESDGDLVTSGRLVELVRSAQGTDVETYAATSRQMTVQLSGTVTLVNGHADVHFVDVDPSFVDVVDTNPTYRALVTPYGATGALYVTNRTVHGFSITESGAASNGVSVDWLVIATRRDYAPTAIPTIPIVSSTPTSAIDLSPDSDAAVSSDALAPLSESGSETSDIVSVVDSIVPDTTSDGIVDAAIAPDAGSDTVVSDAPAVEASTPAEAPSIPDVLASEPSAPAPSADSSGGEVSP
ncbi:MAG: hypothetical protein AAB473_04180 [Patescibacteria group bacterium]